MEDGWSIALDQPLVERHVYVSPTGCTVPGPYADDAFEWAFDFIEHHIDLVTSRGDRRSIPLAPISVADFYATVLDAMGSVRMPVAINPVPNEIADAIPFPDDTRHARI